MNNGQDSKFILNSSQWLEYKYQSEQSIYHSHQLKNSLLEALNHLKLCAKHVSLMKECENILIDGVTNV